MKKACLTTLISLFCLMAQAIPFLIGAYAQYDLPNSADHNILKEKLLESGYNASTISVFGDNLSSLTNLLGIFGSEVVSQRLV